jgi:2-iminobutanoate/2-iminopropanoate deaminase
MSDPERTGGRRAHAPVSTKQAPAAIGPYAQARRLSAGGVEWLFTSGQLGLDPATGQLVPGGTAAEARRALANLRDVLGAAGFDFHDAVKSIIFLVDMADFQAVNEVYGEALDGALPARSTVQVAGLPKGGRVEIELVCVRAAP